MTREVKIEQNYRAAQDFFAHIEIDTEKALKRLEKFSISVQCWQGDDVGGFENPEAGLSGGGIQVTGNYPGKARTIDELQQDLVKAFSLIPGRHRLNLHAIYGDFQGKKVDRNEIEPRHFDAWVRWAKEHRLGLDFNATCFSHPLADEGFTLSNKDKAVRDFWIEHVKRARIITAYFGKQLGMPSIHNLWIPDGYKDIPYDRLAPRQRLKESLDAIYAEKYHPGEMKDSVESKLFGIGSEAYVVGSHEFYLGYAIKNNLMVCLDLGHFHPTENVADKISSILLFSDELMFHFSRGLRWDSDHITLFNDEIAEVTSQIVRPGLDRRVHIAMDFFDATVNRVGAYVLGVRSVLKALLSAILEPHTLLKTAEESNNLLRRLALLEEQRIQPVGAVWDYYCLKKGVPAGTSWLDEVQKYEQEVLSRRK